jgi:pyrroloquinoline quinone (PQQ) biosynthesis protein C
MVVSAFEQLLAATAADYEAHILRNPLFALVAAGGATRERYAVYLRETYHLVRHTSRALARAASRLEDAQRELRAWFLEQAREEHGHEMLCLKDLAALGLDAADVIRSTPGLGAWGIVTQNYYYATDGSPAGLLGVASATEGMGAHLAGTLVRTLEQRYRFPRKATSFLRSHSGFDQRHYADVRRAVDALSRPDDLPWMVHGRRMTFIHYGELLGEVAQPDCSVRLIAAGCHA